MNSSKDTNDVTGLPDTGSTCSFTLREVRDVLDCTVLCGEELLGLTVTEACGSDLMSDVLAFGKPNALLLTGLANHQVVRTAEVADIKAIVFVRGKRPDDTTLQLAREKGIPLMTTRFLMYESCGRLYRAGLTTETTLNGSDEQQNPIP